MAAHIVFEQVGKSYDGADGKPGAMQALADISFEIRRGEIFGIIGRSGAGKSTLLRTINALEIPSQGRVQVQGIDPARLPENDLVQLRRKIGMIFQHFNLLSSKTVWENVALPLRVAGATASQMQERVAKLLDLVGLSAKAQAYPAQLSGGQKQRVGIARALVHSPEVLLCDEATSALDPETTQSILDLLRDINRQLGLTVVLITHDMAVIRAICDRVLVLDHGRMQELGEVWSVFGAPQSAASQAMLHSLKQGLPHAVAQQLQPSPDAVHNHALIGLRFHGLPPGQGLPLAALQALDALCGGAQLIHGGLDHLQGHSVGQLIVRLPASPLPPEETLRQAAGADTLEILGYVQPH
ncbi:methionine ABC transporter ATP-binding protein [Comamonas piscis]|uniref:Cell division ATP-binding protein FtsE n=1 Tax=Comamonas piscis TaxID=1562974 RepID=A0A7G5EBK0_9BURK|nr:methionine ABC transporter ATP-binding protein [Comamonas piscis]QMV71375.1 methionine ABC transporter ATP-binding protein [Comamonas piscis]WSO34081.1 methionine ABC transporter ATP-binding protein [Comamonas piscis]